MPVPLASPVSKPRVDQGGDDAEEIWRCCEEQSRNFIVAKGSDNGRKQICDPTGHRCSPYHYGLRDIVSLEQVRSLLGN